MVFMTDSTQKSRQAKATPGNSLRIAIQGERGSNSHMAALEMFAAYGRDVEIVPCSVSADVVDAVVAARVDASVLPIENSLHGSVAEHYDLLMEHPVRIVRESLMRIRHNLIAAPGVRLEDIRRVLSHPVALNQCRRYLNELLSKQNAMPVAFYDTAGSVKHVVSEKLRDAAGVAPELAAKEYGGEVLAHGIEDHPENYTRFHLVVKEGDPARSQSPNIDKMSVAFAVEHRPGTLVKALQALADVGVDLTQIESRPVPGKPWEYVFYVDLRITGAPMADAALASLEPHCGMVKELGRYREASRQ
jgi:prephenate dehydratase